MTTDVLERPLEVGEAENVQSPSAVDVSVPEISLQDTETAEELKGLFASQGLLGRCARAAVVKLADFQSGGLQRKILEFDRSVTENKEKYSKVQRATLHVMGGLALLGIGGHLNKPLGMMGMTVVDNMHDGADLPTSHAAGAHDIAPDMELSAAHEKAPQGKEPMPTFKQNFNFDLIEGGQGPTAYLEEAMVKNGVSQNAAHDIATNVVFHDADFYNQMKGANDANVGVQHTESDHHGGKVISLGHTGELNTDETTAVRTSLNEAIHTYNEKHDLGQAPVTVDDLQDAFEKQFPKVKGAEVVGFHNGQLEVEVNGHKESIALPNNPLDEHGRLNAEALDALRDRLERQPDPTPEPDRRWWETARLYHHNFQESQVGAVVIEATPPLVVAGGLLALYGAARSLMSQLNPRYIVSDARLLEIEDELRSSKDYRRLQELYEFVHEKSSQDVRRVMNERFLHGKDSETLDDRRSRYAILDPETAKEEATKAILLEIEHLTAKLEPLMQEYTARVNAYERQETKVLRSIGRAIRRNPRAKLLDEQAIAA